MRIRKKTKEGNSMKHRFFLADVPAMFIISILVLVLVNHYDHRVQMVSYQKEATSLGEYQGDIITDGGTAAGSTEPEEVFYNGSDLEDNGCGYAIKVNKKRNVVTVYTLDSNGLYTVPYRAMVCSVGEKGNTPNGVYNLGERAEWLPLEGDVYGQYCTHITGDILFHSVPYFTQNKNDLEIEEYNKLGQSVSAGCVRLSVIDSKWIYDNCSGGTLIEIFESDYDGPLGKPVPAVISSGGEVGNWDPTDPDRENPYIGNIPVIFGAYDREVEKFSDFDIMSGVSAIDSTGVDVTDYIKVDGEVDVTTCGIYKVTYSVTDETGITGAATANIIVKDEQPPNIYVDQQVTSIGMYDVTNTEELYNLLLKNVTAFDGNQQLDDSAIIIDYSEIMNKGFGKCHVKYRAKDSQGNESNVVVLTLDVDLEPPTITLRNHEKREIRVSNMLNDDYLLGMINADDNSGNVEVTLSRPLSYMKNEPYSVIYCAKDAFGNVSTLCVTYQLID